MRKVSVIESIATLFTFLAFIQFGSSPTAAQNITPERGINPNKSYSVSEIETISMQGGNLMLNVPLGTLPPGRGGSGGGISLTYNSKIWDNVTSFVFDSYKDTLSKSGEGGWKYNYGYSLDLDMTNGGVCPSGGDQVDPNIFKVGLVMPDGSKHTLHVAGISNEAGYVPFLPDGSAGCSTFSGGDKIVYHTNDGTFLRLELEFDSDNTWMTNGWTLYMPDGSKVVNYATTIGRSLTTSFVDQRIYDRNGNYVEIVNTQQDAAYANKQTVYLRDEFGRKVVFQKYSPNVEDRIYSKGFGGDELLYRVTWKDMYVNKTYNGCNILPSEPGCGTSSAPSFFKVVDKIYLPTQFADPQNADDYYYEFGYNGSSTSSGTSVGWGELSSVRAPSGAVAEYDYAYDGVNNLYTNYVVIDRPVAKRLIYNLEYDGTTTQKTDTWTYSASHHAVSGAGAVPAYTANTVVMTGPDGSTTTEQYTPDGDLYKSTAPNGTVVEKMWQMNMPTWNGWTPARFNMYPKYEFVSIPDSNGTPVKTAIKEYSQDKNGNTTEVREYDFVAYSSIPRTSEGLASGLPTGISSYLKRISKSEFYNSTPDASSATYNDSDSYHLASSPRLLRLPKSLEIQDASSVAKTRSEMAYDYTNYSSSNTKGGNLTESKRWDSFKGGSSQSYSNPLTSTNSITTSATYNGYGMPLTATDANGNVTQITYGNVAGPSGNVTDIYPTQTVAAYGTSLARTATIVYDFYTGLPTSTTDEDNDVTNSTEYDDLGRPTKVIMADGTALESWTVTDYHDADRFVVVKSDLETVGDGKKVATQFFDQLGRVRLSKTLEDASTQSATNETDGIKVQTRYACTYSSGSGYTYQLTSNPYRAATSSAASGEESMGWTRSKAWHTGRQSEVETFTGTALPAPWGTSTSSTGVVHWDIDSNATTVTDQAGKLRRSITNGLGQLIKVEEPNLSNQLGTSTSPTTGYTYDVLNNLLTVSQDGDTTQECGGTVTSCSQTRTFTYSSLSRLRTGANPESGTITYAYDPNGNLTRKTDARGVQIDYVYDYLNRVTNRNYSTPGGTPSNYQASPNVTYAYGTDAPAVGKLISVASSVSTTEYTGFDILGRVTSQRQTTDGVTYGNGSTDCAMTYTYNLAGALIEQQYPSCRVVKNVLDTNGDLSIVESKKNASSGFWHYADSFTYNAAGAVTSMQLGNGRWEGTVFNSRLQPNEIKLGTVQGGYDNLRLQYSYGDWNGSTIDATKNNGNILQQVITVPNSPGASNAFTATQKYYYDALNRIDDATETVSNQTWRQDFEYDRYGNRNLNETNTTTIPKNCGGAVCAPVHKKFNPAFSSSNNNRLSASDGYSYDSAGNTTGDSESNIFVYDGENKLVQAKNASNYTIGNYYYDGEGKRVKKIAYNPTGAEIETTVFVYDAGGKAVAEYSDVVANSNYAKVAYLTNDHLGSPRINTDANGKVTSRHDYHPFGEEMTAGRTQTEYAGDAVRKQFTGYERDVETELDFAQARYYNSGHGRFTGPDDFTNETRPSDPGSWNLYVYVRNNPLALTDPEGERIYAGDITNADDREEFLKRANFTYGCSACVTIGKDGFLAVDTSGLSKNVLKATQFLTDAINTNDPNRLFSVQITNNNKDVAFGDSRAGSAGVQLPGNNFKTSAIRIRLDFTDDKSVSGDKDAKSAFLNLVFAHEVGHFYPDYITDPEDGRETGPVVDKVNEIQEALALPLRAEYSARQTISGGPWVQVGFGKAKTDKAGQLLRNNGAIQVEKQNKVVRWVKNNVGGKGIN